LYVMQYSAHIRNSSSAACRKYSRETQRQEILRLLPVQQTSNNKVNNIKILMIGFYEGVLPFVAFIY